MRTEVTVNDLYRCGACDERLAGLFNFLESQNIPRDNSMDFDEVITLFNANRLRHFSYWLQANRATLLEYSQIQKEVYVVNGNEFITLDEAIIGAKVIKKERRSYHLSLTSVVFSRSLDEDHTWDLIDIESFIIPDDVEQFHFHIFDHTTGMHTEAYSIPEAIAIRDAVVEKLLNAELKNFEIYKRIYYQECEGVFKDVAL